MRPQTVGGGWDRGQDALEAIQRYLQTLVMGAAGPAVERIKLDVLSWSEEDEAPVGPREVPEGRQHEGDGGSESHSDN